jgi:hypothetical protein
MQNKLQNQIHQMRKNKGFEKYKSKDLKCSFSDINGNFSRNNRVPEGVGPSAASPRFAALRFATLWAFRLWP